MNNKDVKSVLIIGGSSSLGPSIINRFIRKNYKVFSTFFTSSQKTNQAFNFFLDLNNNDSILDFANKTEIKEAKFDVAIFLSGILLGKSIDDYSFDEIEELKKAKICGFLSGPRMVRAKSEASDERPSNVNFYEDNYCTVFSGKIDHSIWIADDVSNWVNAKNN